MRLRTGMGLLGRCLFLIPGAAGTAVFALMAVVLFQVNRDEFHRAHGWHLVTAVLVLLLSIGALYLLGFFSWVWLGFALSGYWIVGRRLVEVMPFPRVRVVDLSAYPADVSEDDTTLTITRPRGAPIKIPVSEGGDALPAPELQCLARLVQLHSPDAAERLRRLTPD